MPKGFVTNKVLGGRLTHEIIFIPENLFELVRWMVQELEHNIRVIDVASSLI